jgi:hypothetical protein
MSLDIERLKKLSDADLLSMAAGFNLQLRRGREMVEEGDKLIKANINEYVMCQNEMYTRISYSISQKTDEIEGENGKV